MPYQDKNFNYTDAMAYDDRAKSSILEKYVLGLWQPFLKNKISELSVNKIVADLGCGTCEYSASAKNAKKIYAVDISGTMLEVCRAKLNNIKQVEIIESSVLTANLPASDLVITIGVWEYINTRDLFEKIKKITIKGSRVIAVFPNIYNGLNWMRSIFKIKKAMPTGRQVAFRPGYIKKLFHKDFKLIECASFGNVFWFPKSAQFLSLPFWKLCDFIWRPFQKFLPLGINVYYLFERK